MTDRAERKRRPLFATLHAYGMSYIDIQQMRVAAESRLRRAVESRLVELGAAKITEDVDEYERNVQKLEILDHDLEARINEEIMNDPLYEGLRKHRSRLYTEEKNVVAEALEVIGDHPIWKWCEQTKGMAEVSAMTFASVLNPHKILSAGNAQHYLGLYPEAKKFKGMVANYNAHMKSRVWLIATGVIKAKDPYYSGLYRLQKHYYHFRPDIFAKRGHLFVKFKETEDGKCGHRIDLGNIDKPELDKDRKLMCGKCNELREVSTMTYRAYLIRFEKAGSMCGHVKNLGYIDEEGAPKPDENGEMMCGHEDCRQKRKVKSYGIDTQKGWYGHVHSMAVRWLMGLLTSHAAEIIVNEEGRELPEHHGYLPYMPEPHEVPEILKRFEASREKLLRECAELMTDGDYESPYFPPKFLTVSGNGQRGKPERRGSAWAYAQARQQAQEDEEAETEAGKKPAGQKGRAKGKR